MGKVTRVDGVVRAHGAGVEAELAFAGFGPHHFGTIYADFPWPGLTGMRRPHYRTMTKRQIINFPMSRLGKENSILLLWATWMHLDFALWCMRHWGYRYASGFPWLKITKGGAMHFGLGIWARGCTEPLLIGVKGKVPNPRPARDGIIVSQRGKHSEKPKDPYDWAYARLPGPHLELFARTPRPGWVSWGDQL